MLIILGKTASGKDTVLNELVEHGYRKMITYTTRPIRAGEIQDKTYHFISEEKFIDMVSKGLFLEYKSYETVDGTCYYGSLMNDYKKADDDTVVILNPDGYKDFLEKINLPHKSIYLYSNNNSIKERLIKRGDKKEEAERRLKQDNADFKGIEQLVDKIVYNNEGELIEKIVNVILRYLKGE